MTTSATHTPHPDLLPLADRAMWIFDMDGTLTVPQHDFAAFRRRHGLPADLDLLSGVAQLPADRATQVSRAIVEWEQQLAAHAQPQPDALALVRALSDRGAVLAVLTRNRRDVAIDTLKAAGLRRHFVDDHLIVGRDATTPKPDPAGVLLLLERAGVAPKDAVMVGDWVHDVQAGKRAQVSTVLVERHGPAPRQWARWIDVCVPQLCVAI